MRAKDLFVGCIAIAAVLGTVSLFVDHHTPLFAIAVVCWWIAAIFGTLDIVARRRRTRRREQAL